MSEEGQQEIMDGVPADGVNQAQYKSLQVKDTYGPLKIEESEEYDKDGEHLMYDFDIELIAMAQNNGVAIATTMMDQRRSCLCSPGVTNRHS